MSGNTLRADIYAVRCWSCPLNNEQRWSGVTATQHLETVRGMTASRTFPMTHEVRVGYGVTPTAWQDGAMDELPPDRVIPEHESTVRRVVSDVHGVPYRAYRSLGEARQDPDGAVVLEGDWGGTIYATCPARLVRCDEESLERLLRDLDGIVWPVNEGEGAGVRYERLPVGSGVIGGMGGGAVIAGVWIHGNLQDLGMVQEIRDVFAGRRDRLVTRYREVHLVVRVDKELERRRVEEGLREREWPYFAQYEVMKIVWSWEEAEREVRRLKRRHRDSNYAYFHAWGPLELRGDEASSLEEQESR